LPGSCARILQQVTQALSEHPSLRLQVISTAEPSEQQSIAEDRAQALILDLATKLDDIANRVETVTATGVDRGILLVFKANEFDR
jgi:hypothetical protein